MSQIVKVERKLEFHMKGGGAGPYIEFDCDDAADILYLLPITDDTGYLAIGNGTRDMDVKWFGGTSLKYILFDVGNSYLSLVNISLYAPNLATSAGQAGIVYVDSNGYLIQSD